MIKKAVKPRVGISFAELSEIEAADSDDSQSSQGCKRKSKQKTRLMVTRSQRKTGNNKRTFSQAFQAGPRKNSEMF
jgi:hypothetical protein